MLKIAPQGSRKRVYEAFKEGFCSASGTMYASSSSTDWAQYDMMERAKEAAANAPMFIDAFYTACQTLSATDDRDDESDELWAPDAGMVNDTLAKHLVGYLVDPPRLLLEEPERVRRRAADAARGEAKEYRYSVALSFAGEDRGYVDEVAALLRDYGVRVFYDAYEEARLWGKNLLEAFAEVYGPESRYVVMFISKAYAKKAWPTHERQVAQAEAFQKNRVTVLPARFDDTEVPGVLPTIGHVDLRGRPPRELAELVLKKLRLSD